MLIIILIIACYRAMIVRGLKGVLVGYAFFLFKMSFDWMLVDWIFFCKFACLI